MSATSVNASLNRCFMRFENRAERMEAGQIVNTFVSVGPLLDVLSAHANQIMYGRRGTGKTHALKYFEADRTQAGDIAIYVDCQNIGSNQSIYDDPTLPISERATRLLIDVCAAMHWAFLDAFSDPKRGWELAAAGPLLNALTDAISEVRIIGPVEHTVDTKAGASSSSGISLGGKVSVSPEAHIQLELKDATSISTGTHEKTSGTEVAALDFNFLTQTLRRLAGFVQPKRIWLLIDEWSTVPSDIQPYLADLLRRSFFSIPNVTVKIAAIEHRSKFKVDTNDGHYVGFELGADISPAINLDDYLVFDNNEYRSTQFFRTLITNHTQGIAKEIGIDLGGLDTNSLIALSFTQENVFVEFVRATEGVPRDAMHILANAAQRVATSAVSMPALRAAALKFYQTDKYNAIISNPENRELLEWIKDEVIGSKKTRAFLLPIGTEDEIIDRLFDRRALHILSRSTSAAHVPGERYILYKLDYGCYVDLINTDKYPHGFLFAETPSLDPIADVPDDDARSYRRAILDLKKFYQMRSGRTDAT